MKNKQYLHSAIAFVCVVAASALLLWGMDAVRENKLSGAADALLKEEFKTVTDADSFEAVDISERGDVYKSITAAYKAKKGKEDDGFVLKLSVKGYNESEPIDIVAAVSSDGKLLRAIDVTAQNETENLGSQIQSKEFLNQFKNGTAPFTFAANYKGLKNGNYHAEDKDFDENGYKEFVDMKVSAGKITEVKWDAYSKDGKQTKREKSEAGTYVMTDTGLFWHEQAEKLEKQMVENQAPLYIETNGEGKTDAVTGVSISITPFLRLSTECWKKAGGEQSGTSVDSLTGATVSSKAVLSAADISLKFTQEFLLEQFRNLTNTDTQSASDKKQAGNASSEGETSSEGKTGSENSDDDNDDDNSDNGVKKTA
jgi:major membrane immunogen (membrane-anchored lipoprotein)